MAITLSTAYMNEINKGSNHPNVILEVGLSSGTVKWGQHAGGFNDVQPILKSVSSLQNKIDTKKGYTTRGQLKFTISGRETIKRLIKDKYLNSRRVSRKDGFVVSGFQYSDYADVFNGKIVNWSRKGDELTITVADDMAEGLKKIPEENIRKTQFINYQNSNPVDIMHDMLSTQLNISTVFIDSTMFTSERDTWLSNWVFDRVITKAVAADKFLNELQMETNSFLIHDGAKITYKVFAPTTPGQNIELWSDNNQIQDNTLSQDSGYKKNFYNRIIVMYDYDESGNDKITNYETIYITQDSSSLSTSEWDETETKEIKAKWIRTRTYTQPSNITGVTLYNVSIDNSTGLGLLTYATGSTVNTLSWTAPGSTAAPAGVAAKLNKAGLFKLFDDDTSKSIRVIVESSSLPASSTTDDIDITPLSGDAFAQALANRQLARYRDPVSTIKFSVDMNEGAWESAFIKPTDIKKITTDEAFSFDSTSWVEEPVMLTSVRSNLNANTINIEAIQTKLFKKYGFIAPAGYPDYTSATDAQKEYAFIADSSAKLGNSTSLTYYIW